MARLPLHREIFRLGWWTTIAEVVCSGTISIDSVSVTPIRPGRAVRTPPCARRGPGRRVPEAVAGPLVLLDDVTGEGCRPVPGDSELAAHDLVPVLRQGVGDLDPEGVEHQVVMVPVGREELLRRRAISSPMVATKKPATSPPSARVRK